MRRKSLLLLAYLVIIPQLLMADECDCECQKCPCIGEAYHDFKQVPVVVKDTGLSKDRPIFGFGVDAIYWYPQQTIDFIPTYTASTSGDTVIYTTHQADYRARWGFKVIGDLFIDEIKSDLECKYLWFDNRKDRNNYNTIATPSSSLYSEIGLGFGNFFNQLSAYLKRSFCAGDFFDFTARGGLFTAWDETWNNIKNDPVDPTDPTLILNYQKWWGMGLYGGTTADFLIPFPYPSDCFGLTLFFDLGGALPWSHTSGRYTSDEFLTASFWGIGPMLEMALGLRYEGITPGYCGKGVRVSGHIAWDCQYWPNHIYGTADSTDLNLYRDYQMQGLTFGMRVQY